MDCIAQNKQIIIDSIERELLLTGYFFKSEKTGKIHPNFNAFSTKAIGTWGRLVDDINDKFEDKVLDIRVVKGRVNIEVSDYVVAKLTRQHFQELAKLDDEGQFSAFSPLPATAPTAPKGSLTEYKKFKDYLIKKLKMRYSTLKLKKAKLMEDPNKNKDELNKLIKTMREIKRRLYGDEEVGTVGLVAEYSMMGSNAPVASLENYVSSDIERVQQLALSENPEDIAEALNIISFYKGLSTIQNNVPNPVFSQDEMFPGGIYDEATFAPIKTQYKSWYDQFEEQEHKITETQKKIVTNLVNSDPRVMRMQKGVPLTYEEITLKDKGMKDISWLDKVGLDISYAYSGNLSLLEQVISATTHDVFEEQSVFTKQKVEEIDKLIKGDSSAGRPSLDKALSDEGVDFKVFIDENTGELIDRYSTKYRFTEERMLRAFEAMLHSSYEMGISDTEAQARKRAAYTFRDEWYEENTTLITAGMFPALSPGSAAHPRAGVLSSLTPGELSDYQDQLQNLKQSYFTELQELFGVLKFELGLPPTATEADLERASPSKYYEFVKFREENNPEALEMELSGARPRYIVNREGTGRERIYPKAKYALRIPKKTDDAGRDLGYYESKFEIVNRNPVLKDFLRVSEEVLATMYSNLPPRIASEMTERTIPNMQKTFMEMVVNSKLPGDASGLAKGLWDTVKDRATVREEAEFKPETADVMGITDETPNASFIKKNNAAIKQVFTMNMMEFLQLAGDVSTRISEGTVMQRGKLTAEQLKSLESMLDELDETPSDYLGIVGSPDVDFKQIPVGKIIHRHAVRRVLGSQSEDLPMIMKYFSKLSSEYAARTQLQPLVNIAMKQNDEIQKIEKGRFGVGRKKRSGKPVFEKEGRKNARERLQSFYRRVILGDYSSKFPIDDKKVPVKRHFTTEEKEMLVVFDKQMANIEDRINTINASGGTLTDAEYQEVKNLSDNIDRIESMKRMLGKSYTIGSIYNIVMEYMRFMGLAYNIKSSMNNYLEGQLSNSIAAQLGLYYTEENYYRAMGVSHGATIRFLSGRKISTGASAKVRALMDRYDILQDASDVLQRSSKNNTMLRSNWYRPYEIISRTEYQNQSVVMIAILMDTKITGKNGKVSSVFDAMDEHGMLLPDFATAANKKNWEQSDGEHYRETKLKINNAITSIHGDYDELRGNIMSSSKLVQPFLMFKRWMPMQFYLRFGAEQENIVIGGKFKGRYRSHSLATGGAWGTTAALFPAAAVGVSGMGLVGAGAVGAGLGIAWAMAKGIGRTGNQVAITGFALKDFAKKTIGFPINLAARRTVIGKSSVTASDLGLTELDFNNMRANITELTMQLYLLMAQLMAMSFIKDDDEPEMNKWERMRNVLMNQTGQILGQMSLYTNPIEMWNNLVVGAAGIRFIESIIDLGVAATKMVQGRDTLMSGPWKGHSRMYKSIEKFLPGPARRHAGFYGAELDQYEETIFDNLPKPGWKVDRKEISTERNLLRMEIKEYFHDMNRDGAKYDMDEVNKEITKYLNEILPLPKDPDSKSKKKSKSKPKKPTTKQKKIRKKIKEAVD